MRAKTINEIQKFERGIDPKDAMNIGDPKLREIFKNLRDVENRIKEALNGEDIDFNDTVYRIDYIKNAFDYIIINFIKNKYQINLKYNEDYLLNFANGTFKGANISLSKSNSGASIYFEIIKNGLHYNQSSSSKTLHTFDKKFNKLLKELNLI